MLLPLNNSKDESDISRWSDFSTQETKTEENPKKNSKKAAFIGSHPLI